LRGEYFVGVHLRIIIHYPLGFSAYANFIQFERLARQNQSISCV